MKTLRFIHRQSSDHGSGGAVRSSGARLAHGIVSRVGIGLLALVSGGVGADGPVVPGEWVARAPLPLEYPFVDAACEVDGAIYAFFTWVAGYSPAAHGFLVHRYDPTADRWQAGAPTPVWRLGCAACAVDGIVYLIGGRARLDGYPVFGRVDAYDTAQDTWSTRASVPGVGQGVGACVVDGIIYAVGGADEQRAVNAYDPAADSWTPKPRLPVDATGRSMPAAVNGQIYVLTPGNVCAYDPRTDTWSTRALPSPWGDREVIGTLDGLILLAGGGESVLAYNPAANAFVEVGPAMPTPRTELAGVAVGDRLFVIGGREQQSGFPSAVNEAFAAGALLPEIDLGAPFQTMTASGALVLTATITNVRAPCDLQWQRDGVDIEGATGPTYTLPCAQCFHSGSYSVRATSALGTTTSAAAQVTVDRPAANGSRFMNLSTRASCLEGDGVLITGFVVEGIGSKRVLIRAVGPTLAGYGVSTPLADPVLTLKARHGGAWQEVASNDNWGAAPDADVIAAAAAGVHAFELARDSLDAALLVDLPAGTYTVVVSDLDGTGGVALVELYDADAGSPGGARLANLSSRGCVGIGGEVMIPGFVVSSEGPKTFLLRAIGPTLSAFGVSGVLADPRIAVYRRLPGDPPIEQLILGNDNWGEGGDVAELEAVAAQVHAFPLAPGSADAAMLVTLPPGIYTAVASGADGGTGVALVELYEAP